MTLESEISAEAPVPPNGKAASNRNAKSSDFDRELGAKIRAARLSAGMTQAALGVAIFVSFQQMQKYESGRDRVAAGTLQKIGDVLGIHPKEFFGKAPAPVGGVAELREAMSIAASVQSIPSASLRKRLLALIEELADRETAEPGRPE